MRLFVTTPDVPVSEIAERSGVERRSVYRLFQRCLEVHPDTRIMGLRALVPFRHVKEYMRTAPVTSPRLQGASAGAFSQLLSRYPRLDKFVEKAARDHRKATQGKRAIRRQLSTIHKKFLEICRDLGIEQHEYPFNREYCGIRSLAKHLKQANSQTFEHAAQDAGATHIGKLFNAEKVKAPVVDVYHTLEFDGHRVDVRLTMRVLDPFGLEVIYEIERIWILVLLDVCTRAVVGYSLAFGAAYSKEDVIEAFRSALIPYRPLELTIPGLTYSAAGGVPSSKYPQTQYACWDFLLMDNAKAHIAEDTLALATEVVGCWPQFGKPYEPDERPHVERFFGLVAKYLSHRMPGTTGSGPTDIARALGDPHGDLRLLVTFEELKELVDVTVWDYNGTSHSGVGGRTPLEAMGFYLDKRADVLRTLAFRRRDPMTLLQQSLLLQVRGSLKHGVRPHVNFHNVRYASDVLASNPALLKTTLRIYFDHKDIRYLRAYFENGDELGLLMAAKPWCFTPHSLKTRQRIMKMRAQGKLKYREGDDPVEAFSRTLRERAKKSRRAATELARLDQIASAQSKTKGVRSCVQAAIKC